MALPLRAPRLLSDSPGRPDSGRIRDGPINALHHVTVKTDDLDATRDFYSEVLGLEVGFRPDLDFPGLLALLRPDAGGASGAAGERDRRRAVDTIPARSTISPSSPRISTASRRGSKRRASSSARTTSRQPPIDQLFFPDNNNVMVELNFPRS